MNQYRRIACRLATYNRPKYGLLGHRNIITVSKLNSDDSRQSEQINAISLNNSQPCEFVEHGKKLDSIYEKMQTHMDQFEKDKSRFNSIFEELKTAIREKPMSEKQKLDINIKGIESHLKVLADLADTKRKEEAKKQKEDDDCGKILLFVLGIPMITLIYKFAYAIFE